MHYQISFIDLAWMAGIMEGEGYIALTKPQDARRSGHVRVSISNCDPQLLEPFFTAWGGYFRASKTPPGNRRQSWQWTIDALRAKAFLEAIRPYVRSDRMKARIDLATTFQESKSSTRFGQRLSLEARDFQDECRRQMLVLNHRGKVSVP